MVDFESRFKEPEMSKLAAQRLARVQKLVDLLPSVLSHFCESEVVRTEWLDRHIHQWAFFRTMNGRMRSPEAHNTVVYITYEEHNDKNGLTISILDPRAQDIVLELVAAMRAEKDILSFNKIEVHTTYPNSKRF